MQKPELLAPAGNLEIFKAAIQAGADAVYCSGKLFGARYFANNFTNEEIIEASHYAHLHNKLIYITVNTIIFDDELDELASYIDFLYQYVDGLIIQDLGLLHYVRTNYPDFPCHISTQMNIHNLADARFLHRLGVKRIVLARETPLDVIKQIIDDKIEVEVFVHGALCFSYSGNCYLSKEIGGRSGNRGMCAQPCRKRYSLFEDEEEIVNNKPLISMRDLFTLNDLSTLCSLGIASFKIEGRMKSMSYVTEAIKAYREAIDAFYNHQKYLLSNETRDHLAVTFNREYTKGYILNASRNSVVNLDHVNHQGIRIGKVVSATSHTVTIKLESSLEVNDAIRFKSADEVGMVVTKMLVNQQAVKRANYNDFVTINTFKKIAIGTVVLKTKSNELEIASKKILQEEHYFNLLSLFININQHKVKVDLFDQILNQTISIERGNLLLDKIQNTNDIENVNERIMLQFSKTNKRPIHYEKIELNNKDSYFVPLPLINEIRNLLLLKWEDAKKNQVVRCHNPYIDMPKLLVKERDLPIIFVNRSNKHYHIDCQKFLMIDIPNPRIDFYYTPNSQVRLIDHLSDLPTGGMISPYINIANSWAIDFIRHFSSDLIFLSLELDEKRAKDLLTIDNNLGVMVYSKIPLMVSNHCVVGNYYQKNAYDCLNCQKHHYQLEDEYHKKYDLVLSGPKNNCQMTIVNAKSTINFSNSANIKKLYEFYNESEEEVLKIISEYHK